MKGIIMKYTKPTVATATAQSVDPRILCTSGFTCGTSGDHFSCILHFKCEKKVNCQNYN